MKPFAVLLPLVTCANHPEDWDGPAWHLSPATVELQSELLGIELPADQTDRKDVGPASPLWNQVV